MGDNIGHLAAADKGPFGAVGHPDEIADPGKRLQLDTGRAGGRSPQRRVLIERTGDELANHTDR
jgi:hypothetical protein